MKFFAGKTAWPGDVEVFDLTGHPESQTVLRVDTRPAGAVHHNLGIASGGFSAERG